jgi:hypothetical protein
MPSKVHVRIFARWNLILFKLKKCQVLCETVGWIFLIFLPKTKDAHLIWQIIGDVMYGQKIN